VKSIIAAWERFWFAPQSTSTVAVWRVAFGLLVLAWTLALAPDLFAFFSSHGIISEQPTRPARLPLALLHWFPSDAALITAYAVLLLASVCLTVGYHSRLASLLVFVGVLSFQGRNPFVFNSGDLVIRAIAFYIVLAPTGVALSLDQWRKGRDRFWECPARGPWALRLMQIQVSVIYLTTVLAKFRGETWTNGTAVSYAFRLADILRFPLPSWLTDNVLVANLLTYGTLALELSLALLIWNRRLRPVVLLAGVLFHLAIDYAILVGFFSFAMLVCYTVFISPEWLDARLAHLRGRLEGAGFRAPRAWLPASLSRCLFPDRGRLLIGTGTAIQAVGLIWDVVLHARGFNLVHGTLGLENPAHRLYLAGLIVCGWGVVSELALSRVRRRTGFSLRASLAAPAIAVVCVMVLLMARAGAAALTPAGTPDSPQHQGHVHAHAGAGEADPVLAALYDVLRRRGLRAAMDELERQVNADPRVSARSHPLAHALGRYATQIYGSPAEAMKHCRDILSGGCYHGALETVLDSKRDATPKELMSACDADMPAGVRYQCLHALGHVLNAVLDHNLFRALASCDALGPVTDREMCYDGVFMENMVLAAEQVSGRRGVALGQHNAARHAAFLKAGDPLYPCNAVAPRYRERCYQMQTSGMLGFREGSALLRPSPGPVRGQLLPESWA
jgi:hypothetical protein